MLAARGIPELYTHQADAFRLCLEDRNIVVVTPTASGKTLCYNLPVLNTLIANQHARALYLFPTKALAIDQLHELQSALDAPIQLMLSGPMGGDAQLGTLIAEGRIDAVFFFWDPLTPQPHDVDVKALLRLAVLYDVSIACNRSSADHIISSPLFTVPEKYRKDRGPNYAPWAR